MLPALRVYCFCCYNICHSLHSRAIKLSGLSEVWLIQRTPPSEIPVRSIGLWWTQMCALWVTCFLVVAH